jgi:predicted ATPase
MTHPCLVTRIVLHNFKSIKACSVRLNPLTFLIGPNASGKSNFLDALQFVADALSSSLEEAFEKRGGIAGLRHKHRDEDPFVRCRIEMIFADHRHAHYSFEPEHTPSGPRVRKEQCAIRSRGLDTPLQFHVDDDTALQNRPDPAKGASSRELFLKALPKYRLVRDALANNRIYNFSLACLRASNSIPGELVLAGNGQNLSRTLSRLKREAPEAFARRIFEKSFSATLPN